VSGGDSVGLSAGGASLDDGHGGGSGVTLGRRVWLGVEIQRCAAKFLIFECRLRSVP
jgi:hypothetical protein